MICPYCKNKLEKQGLNHCPSCGGALTRNAELEKDAEFCPSVKIFSLLCFIFGIVSVASANYIFAIASLVMYVMYNKTTLVYDVKVKIGRVLSIVCIVLSAVEFLAGMIAVVTLLSRMLI